ncbi:hypothetical protein ACN469_30705 [Corallococcus terminator]
MRFALNVDRVHALPELAPRYDEELDDVRSILADVCTALAETGTVDFVVSGFGQEHWPVDVQTDLVVFLEQLSEALTSIDAEAPFILDFYEQGLERSLHFEFQSHHYLARCESHTEWRPAPMVESIGKDSLQEMLGGIRRSFVRMLERLAPHVASHPWMRAWAGATP